MPVICVSVWSEPPLVPAEVLAYKLPAELTTVQEFAQLYDELKEFEVIEEQYNKIKNQTVKHMLEYAAGHLPEFVKQD